MLFERASHKKRYKTAMAAAHVRLCRFLYVAGIQNMRLLKRVKRRFCRFAKPFSDYLKRIYISSVGVSVKKYRDEKASISYGISVAKKRFAEAKKYGVPHVVKEFFSVANKSYKLHKGFFTAVFNITLPILSVLLLAFTVNYWSGRDFGLVLENSGEHIGVIADENTYEKATRLVSQRMVHDSAQDDAKIAFAPGFKLAVTDGDYLTSGYVCDRLIKQSDGIIEEASGLYVDGQMVGAVKSSADMRYLLQSLLNAAKNGGKGITAEFAQDVEVVSGLFPTTSIISTDSMGKMLSGTSKDAVTYTVKDGDTVTSIAQEHSMTVSQLNAVNGNSLGDSIHPGDLIKIEVAVPKMSIKLYKTETYNVSLPYSTITKNDDSRYTDYSQVITEGVNGTKKCTDKVCTVNGVETSRENVSTVVTQQPVDKVVLTGTKKKPQTGSGISSGSLMWPVPSLHTITTYFTWRWGSFHYGIDISGPSAYGKTIVAADGGTVSAAGWGGGYGNRVIINHGNGLVTVYGHASKVLVSAGQKVSKGQPIARVGSTGNSTGPHCHFEVRKNGTKVDPLKYVSN